MSRHSVFRINDVLGGVAAETSSRLKGLVQPVNLHVDAFIILPWEAAFTWLTRFAKGRLPSGTTEGPFGCYSTKFRLKTTRASPEYSRAALILDVSSVGLENDVEKVRPEMHKLMTLCICSSDFGSLREPV